MMRHARGNILGSLLGILVCGGIGGFAAWFAVSAWEIDGVPGAIAAAAIGMDQPVKLDFLWAGFCLLGAVYFIFRSA